MSKKYIAHTNISEKNIVRFPKEIRRKLNTKSGSILCFFEESDEIIIRVKQKSDLEKFFEQ